MHEQSSNLSSYTPKGIAPLPERGGAAAQDVAKQLVQARKARASAKHRCRHREPDHLWRVAGRYLPCAMRRNRVQGDGASEAALRPIGEKSRREVYTEARIPPRNDRTPYRTYSMKTSSLHGLVLAIHPYRRGFGWVIFESPLSPVDWGVTNVSSDYHVRCLFRVERIIERYEPGVVLLEQFASFPSRRHTRIQKFCRGILQLAATRGIETRVYSRAAIRTCLGTLGASTRYEIAQVVAMHIEVFRQHLPPVRKAWLPEHPRQAMFDAAALAITHFTVT